MKLLYVLLLFVYMVALLIYKYSKKEKTKSELFFIDLTTFMCPLVAILIGTLS